MYVPGSTLSMLKGHFVQDAHKVSIALCDVASLGGQVGAQKANGTAKSRGGRFSEAPLTHGWGCDWSLTCHHNGIEWQHLPCCPVMDNTGKPRGTEGGRGVS